MARSTRTVRAELPNDVWDRLADEAAAAGVPLGRFLRNLIVTRDAKRQARAQVSDASDTRPSNRK